MVSKYQLTKAPKKAIILYVAITMITHNIMISVVFSILTIIVAFSWLGAGGCGGVGWGGDGVSI